MNERTANARESDILNGYEAAEMLPGVSYATLMRWAREGKVPSHQYVSRGKRMFLRSDIEALLTPRVMSPDEVGDDADHHHTVMAGQEVLTW